MGCILCKSALSEVVILVIGLDNSGKTTLTHTINGGMYFYIQNIIFFRVFEIIECTCVDLDPFIVPTVGFSAPIRKRISGLDAVFYDLGGGSRIRGVWPQYFADVHAVIYVVDSGDKPRLHEAAKELKAALLHPMLVGKPTLV